MTALRLPGGRRPTEKEREAIGYRNGEAILAPTESIEKASRTEGE